MKKRKNKTGGEVLFDPDARKNFLQGFSDRKRQRRAFGLAMQRVKDRKSKLEERAETRLAIKEQVEQAEKEKERMLETIMEEHGVKLSFQEPAPQKDTEPSETTQQSFKTDQWGANVTVTTSTIVPDYDGEEKVERKPPSKERKRGTDAEQEQAGSVEKFLHQLKGNMPGKKKSKHQSKHKGKHGASSMKGMATGADLKMAQKVLARTEAKKGGVKHRKKRGR